MTTKTAEKSHGWRLLEGLPKGTTLWTVLRRVSRSGMTRIIDVYTIQDNEPRPAIVLEYWACAKDARQAWEKWGGEYKVKGCGMDMGFDLVYNLGHLVHGDGYYFKQKWI